MDGCGHNWNISIKEEKTTKKHFDKFILMYMVIIGTSQLRKSKLPNNNFINPYECMWS